MIANHFSMLWENITQIVDMENFPTYISFCAGKYHTKMAFINDVSKAAVLVNVE